jgi:hypothetical protein
VHTTNRFKICFDKALQIIEPGLRSPQNNMPVISPLHIVYTFYTIVDSSGCMDRGVKEKYY